MNTPLVRRLAVAGIASLTLVAAAGAAAAQDKAGTSDSTSPQTFVTQAAGTDLMEIKLGKLALKQSQNSQVKTFAQQMIDDHSAFQDKLEQTAKSQNLDLPGDIPSAMQKKYQHMATLSGHGFDKAYARFNVKGHRQAVALFKQEKASTQNAQVSQLAATGLPVIESHLTKAKQLSKQVEKEQGA